MRALEGEIARTIQAMKGVKAARVHIVLPEAGSFRRTRQQPSASVIIRTESADDFSSAAAIRHLVAAAVPGMTVDQVTVLNTDGTCWPPAAMRSTPRRRKMLTLEKTIGKELQDNIAQDAGALPRASTTSRSASRLRLNTDKRQTNETTFNPERRVERSVRVVKETGNSQNSNANRPVGVEQNVPADQSTTTAGRRRPVEEAERAPRRS